MRPYLPLLFAAGAVYVSGCASCPCKCPLGFCKTPEPKVEYTTRSPSPKMVKLASTPAKKAPKAVPEAIAKPETVMPAVATLDPEDSSKDVTAAGYVAPTTPAAAPAQVDFNALAAAAPEIQPNSESQPTTDTETQTATEPKSEAPVTQDIAPAAATDKPLVAGDVLAAEGYGHAPDYSWVQGQLTKVHSRGGFWQIRYAAFDQVDDHGGNFIITTELEGDFSDGDTVRIEGRPLEYDRKLSGTSYHVHHVRLIRKGASMLE